MIYFARKIIWKSKFFRDIRKLYLEFSGNFIVFCFLYPKVKKIYTSLEEKNYQQAISIAQKILDSGYLIGLYYKAKVHYLYGQDKEAKVILETYLEKQKNHADAIYLYAEVLFFLKKDALAWDILIKFIPKSNRGKTWQILAKFVTTNERFYTYKLLFFEKYKFPPEQLPTDILEHLTQAAFRSGNQEKVVLFWGKKYEELKNKRNFSYKSKTTFSIYDAERALRDLKKIFDSNNVPFFLVSGTLLGCIREGQLLGHDKDIDLGVWDTFSAEQLIRMIRLAGCFFILPNSTEDLVVVRHLNGISIDIFIHRKVDGYIYHSGVKCVWRNTSFTLQNYLFLNELYSIPDNYNLYLEENYGYDWRIPKINFDSALDTPNLMVTDKHLMVIYLYKKMIQLPEKVDKRRYEQAIKDISASEVS